MLEDILTLREKSLVLSELGVDALRELLPLMAEVRIPAGADLVCEGEEADSAYFVLEGKLEVLVRNERAVNVAINEIGPGDALGEVTLFCGGRRTATVRALTDCRLVSLSLDALGRLLDGRPELTRKLMESAARRLRRSQLAARLEQVFGPLDREVIRELEGEMEWLSLRGGQMLFRQGQAARSAYIVIEGRLRVVTENASDEVRVLDEVGPGETVGEIALITEGTRSASVYAVRDSEVVRFSRGSFERLADKYPRVMVHVSRLLGSRLLRTRPEAERRSAAPTTITLIPAGKNDLFRDFVDRLVEGVSRFGPTRHLNSSRIDLALARRGISRISEDHPAALRLQHWLSEQEAAHEYVIYEGDLEWSGWTERCLNQADHLLFIACSDTEKGLSQMEKRCLDRMTAGAAPRTTLVLLHPEGTEEPKESREWLAPRNVDDHYHVRQGRAGDHERLARILTGRAIGLVLGGGGARGFAHIGVLRAFEEAGIPVDFVGGTSQGSIIGGGWGMGLDWEEIFRRCKDLFSSLFDFTLPLVSLIAGRRIHGKLLNAFGERNIEDLPVTFFCISTNLTQAKEVVHRAGPLHRAVRSSISLPGFMPPVCLDGDLLIDGGLLNNVPVDVMRTICGKGQVIAVDVAPSAGTGRSHDFPSELSGWGLALHKLNPFQKRALPPYITTTMAMATFVGGINARLRRKEAGLADLYLEVPVGRWGILDFGCMEDIVEVGYRYASSKLREEALPPTET